MTSDLLFFVILLAPAPFIAAIWSFLVGRYGTLDDQTQDVILAGSVLWPVTLLVVAVTLVCGPILLGVVWAVRWCGEKGKTLQQRKAQ